MTEFNQGWWNCFLSYTDIISFSTYACDFAKDQMNGAGVRLSEIEKVLTDDYIMSDRTREILLEYKKQLRKKVR